MGTTEGRNNEGEALVRKDEGQTKIRILLKINMLSDSALAFLSETHRIISHWTQNLYVHTHTSAKVSRNSACLTHGVVCDLVCSVLPVHLNHIILSMLISSIH